MKKTLFTFILILVSVTANAKYTSLKVAVSGFSGTQREAFILLASNFEALHPQYQVDFILTEDKTIKSSLSDWLAGGKDIDLAIWHAGERLKAIARNNLVRPLTELWYERNYDRFFTPSMKQACSDGGQIYGIPISTYQWGFYYSKSLFDRLKIKEPATWEEFTKVLNILRSNGVVPIQLASQSNWPVAGWYEYLNLRINGLAAQRNLSNIQTSLNEKEVRKVLLMLRELVNIDAFTEHHRNMSWKESLPDIYRDKAGMALYGNFVESALSKNTIPLLGYFPFPKIHPDMPVYEVAPTDILIISRNTKNLEASKVFLNYVAAPETQAQLNDNLLQISPNQLSTSHSQSHLLREGRKVIAAADGFTQYFDRDAPKEISEAYIKIWKDFIDNPDIEMTLSRMKQARYQLANVNQSK